MAAQDHEGVEVDLRLAEPVCRRGRCARMLLRVRRWSVRAGGYRNLVAGLEHHSLRLLADLLHGSLESAAAGRHFPAPHHLFALVDRMHHQTLATHVHSHVLAPFCRCASSTYRRLGLRVNVCRQRGASSEISLPAVSVKTPQSQNQTGPLSAAVRQRALDNIRARITYSHTH